MNDMTVITAEQANGMRQACKEKIALAIALERLETNPDFQMFITEYLEKEPVRLVHLLGDASVNMSDKKESFRADIQERMVGISRLAEFMRNINMLANQARKTLEDLSNAEIGE